MCLTCNFLELETLLILQTEADNLGQLAIIPSPIPPL